MGSDDEPGLTVEPAIVLDRCDELGVQPPQGRRPQVRVGTGPLALDRPAGEEHQVCQLLAADVERQHVRRVRRDDDGHRGRLSDEVLHEDLIGRQSVRDLLQVGRLRRDEIRVVRIGLSDQVQHLAVLLLDPQQRRLQVRRRQGHGRFPEGRRQIRGRVQSGRQSRHAASQVLLASLAAPTDLRRAARPVPPDSVASVRPARSRSLVWNASAASSRAACIAASRA